jgi:hypothetical protein
MMEVDSILHALEKEFTTFLTRFLVTTRTHLEAAYAAVNEERRQGFAVVAEQRTKAVLYVKAQRTELDCEIKDMQTWKERQEGHVELNVGGRRFETSAQTIFSRSRQSSRCLLQWTLHARCVCADDSIFIDRDSDLFGHVLEFLRDGVLSVAEQEERPSVEILRRLKREFSYFRIALYADQVGDGRQVDLFDSLIAVAGQTQICAVESCEEAAKDEEEALKGEESDEEEEDNPMSSREATRRNKARRDAKGQEAENKYCRGCFEDEELTEFQKHAGKIFDKATHCKTCVSRKRLSRAGMHGKSKAAAILEEEKSKGCREGTEEGEEKDNEKEEEMEEGKEVKGAEVEEDEEDEEASEGEESDEESKGSVMSSREAVRRNKARRDAEGETATFKYCSGCFEDKELAKFHEHHSQIFKRQGHCKTCASRNRPSRAGVHRKLKAAAERKADKSRGGGEGEEEEEEEEEEKEKEEEEENGEDEGEEDEDDGKEDEEGDATMHDASERDAKKLKCTKCRKEKVLADFHRDANKIGGRCFSCKLYRKKDWTKSVLKSREIPRTMRKKV